MRRLVRLGILSVALSLGAVPALAQSHLRIGIGDDPDVLDPTQIGRAHV